MSLQTSLVTLRFLYSKRKLNLRCRFILSLSLNMICAGRTKRARLSENICVDGGEKSTPASKKKKVRKLVLTYAGMLAIIAALKPTRKGPAKVTETQICLQFLKDEGFSVSDRVQKDATNKIRAYVSH